MTDSERVQWYRDQQSAHTLGSRRQFTDISYGEQRVATAGDENRTRVHYMPWWVFRNSRLAANIPFDTVVSEFVSAVNSGGTQAIWQNDEWCVAVFSGVIRDVLDTDVQQQVEKRRKTIDDAQDLAALRETGDRMLQQHLQQIPVPKALGSSEAPRCNDVSLAEQPVVGALPTTFRSQVQREVNLNS